MAAATKFVHCFGCKKTAVVVTLCKPGRGLTKINKVPIELAQSKILQFKAFEPVLLGIRFNGIVMRIHVKGDGKTSEV